MKDPELLDSHMEKKKDKTTNLHTDLSILHKNELKLDYRPQYKTPGPGSWLSEKTTLTSKPDPVIQTLEPTQWKENQLLQIVF